ncbi:hypothetical protein [Pseudonocardia zijingensis]|uniref:Uncharacterized protein n=1 Tax=Pseudonocardia zijingensis TaxID=153376 RepID=A0ABN1N8S4_9PSEU
MRKRQPEAMYLDGGSVLVKHTHDVELADRLAREAIVEHELFGEATDEERAEICLPDPLQRWVRIINALPGSYAEAEGWGWECRRDQPGRRGVFPAVEYLR